MKIKKYAVLAAGNIVVLLFLLMLAFFIILPIYFLIIQSFRPFEELYYLPPSIYPNAFTVSNFTGMIHEVSSPGVLFPRYFFNSILISALVTILQILIICPAAFILAKVDFIGRKIINRAIEITILFTLPAQGVALFFMQYVVNVKLGLIDTYSAMIFPFVPSVIGLYLMRQYMRNFPDSIKEAAEIEGAGLLRICWEIIIPNVKPSLVTLIVFAFIGSFQVSGYSPVYSETLKTLPMILNEMAVMAEFEKSAISYAVTVVFILPPIIVFAFCGSGVVKTLEYSAIRDYPT